MTIARAARHAALYALEALAVLIALAIFCAAALLWRLSSGPVEADFLRPAATAALAEAFGGAVADVDVLQIGYDPALSALMVRGEGVTILDADGAPVTAADSIEAGKLAAAKRLYAAQPTEEVELHRQPVLLVDAGCVGEHEVEHVDGAVDDADAGEFHGILR